MNTFELYHPNAKMTGTAVKFELYPADDGCEGHIALWIAPQKPTETIGRYAFDWDKAARVMFSPIEIGGLLEVLRGYHEKLEDGRGYYHQNNHRTTLICFEHRIEPIPSYVLTLTVKDEDEEPRKMAFALTMREALVLAEVFTSSLVRMAFG